MRTLPLILLQGSVVFCPTGTLLAQNYSGTFSISNQQGGAVTVTLRQGQGAGGKLTGSMTGNGVQFEVEGMVEDGTAMGAISNASGGVFFEGYLDGNQLTLILIDVGPGNMADYSSTQNLLLSRTASGGRGRPPVAGGGPPGQPPTGGGGQAQTPGSPEGFMGQWQCQTPQGPARLYFLSQRELVYNGERSPYELGQGVIRVPGDWGPDVYGYSLAGDQLTVTNPDGSRTQCRRAEAVAQGGGSGMEGLLQGHRCAYSSSPDGGYSTLYRMYFDGQGRFLWGTESSFSGDPGYAYGLNNHPDAGTYQVTGTGRGAAIHITWPDGSQGTAQVYLGDAQGIYEFQLNGRHFAPALYGGSP